MSEEANDLSKEDAELLIKTINEVEKDECAELLDGKAPTPTTEVAKDDDSESED